MKKILVFLLLILVSCQKDEIIIEEPKPAQELIFNLSEVIVKDGQDISFEILTSEPHQLIISSNNSVLTKETFEPKIGINTRKIFTKILSKEKLKLSLEKNGEVIQETFIIVE